MATRKRRGSLNAPAFPDLAIPVPNSSRASPPSAPPISRHPSPTHAERVADLKALGRLVKGNQTAILAAINADYGNRSKFETLFGEAFVVLDGIRDAARRVKSWMKPRRRSVDLLTFAGASNRLLPQPLGVVGVIVPWNSRCSSASPRSSASSPPATGRW